MQFPLSWLNEFLPNLAQSAPDQLADFLTMSGLEVEELISRQAQFTKVIVAQIVSLERHPDAERLNVCQVNNGVEIIQIVCGAKNVRAGLKVPLAQVGAELSAHSPTMVMKVAKLRGIMSHGMLCSARELGVSEESEGLMELPEDAPVGADFGAYWEIADTLFNIKLTPNRGDCLSILGVARDAARFAKQTPHIPVRKTIVASCDDKLTVSVKAPELCWRFTGRVVRQVNAKAISPTWMKRRLEACGMRSVSALVDISNYVMLELGHPTHIFDRDKISGGLTVRMAHPDETLTLLDGRHVVLNKTYGVIADTQQVESLAGIMGGAHSAVSDSTQNIFIEIGAWAPDAIQGRARALGLQTDAGYRFERGVDYADHVAVMERVCELVDLICATPETAFGPIDDQLCAMPSEAKINLRLTRLHKILGVPMSEAEVRQCFDDLGLRYHIATNAQTDAKTDSDTVFSVEVPSFRFDLKIEEDLIEECARVYGFDRIPASLPQISTPPLVPDEARHSLAYLRTCLVNAGYQEVINYSFVPPDWESDVVNNQHPITLQNPIAAHLAVMRSSLVPSLLETLGYNLDRRATRLRIFEMARVFSFSEQIKSSAHEVKGIAEVQKIAGLAYGDVEPMQWGTKSRAVDFYDVKAEIEALIASDQLEWLRADLPWLHPGQSATIYQGDKCLGYLGALHPKLLLKYKLEKIPVVFELDSAAVQTGDIPKYARISKYPTVWRDVAFVVPENISADQFVKVFSELQKKTSAAILRSIVLFDHFRGGNLSSDQKSLAFRIELQSDQNTLQDDAVEALIAHFVTSCEASLGAQLR